MDESLFGMINSLVKEIEIYRNGVAVVKRRATPSEEPPPRGDRKPIKYLSSKARSKMLYTISVTEVEFKTILTLTYPKIYPMDGTIVKDHLRRMVQEIRRIWKVEVFWFIEFQLRGAPHFHIFTTDTEINDRSRRRMASTWARVIGLRDDGRYMGVYGNERIDMNVDVVSVHSHERAWERIRSSEGCVRYAAKYALKTEQKFVPLCYQDVGRFWGCSAGVRRAIKPVGSMPVTYEVLQEILKDESHPASGFDIAPTFLFNCDAVRTIEQALRENVSRETNDQ